MAEHYQLYRISFEADRPVREHIGIVDSFDEAHAAAGTDYGMDVGEGVWFPHGYVINCGPEYRGDGKTVNYLITPEEGAE